MALLGEKYSAQKKREEGSYVTLLPEAKEYGLLPEPERVDWRKRALYSGSASGTVSRPSGSGGRSGRAGAPSFPRPTDPYAGPEGSDYTAPPPPPTQSGFDSGASGPDFFEPDIPPPPPEGGYDDDIPPPIFDEPEF